MIPVSRARPPASAQCSRGKAGATYVVSLPEDRRGQLEARMRKRLLGDRNDAAFVLKARAWCVRGEVPKGG